MTTKTAKSTTENGNAAAVQAAVDKAVAKTKAAKAQTVIALNIDDLDLGDCIDVEEITGEPAVVTFAAMETGHVRATALAALVWVAKRKTDPAFTYEDAKRTKVTSLDSVLGDADQAQG